MCFVLSCTIYNYVTLLLCVIILMLCRLGTQLSHIEATEGITIRWTPESDPFQDYLSLKRFKERERLLESMSVTARERWFLLKLKAKFAGMFVHNYDLCMHTCTVSHSDYNYADGQYLASRLSKSITRESTRLKGLVTSYNGLAMESERLSWHDVTDLSSSLWSRGVLRADHGLIPKSIKLDSVAAHHNILRAEEEISLIKTEMVAVVSFYLKDREILLQGIQQLHDADRSCYTTGCIFVLQLACLNVELKLYSVTKSFGRFVELPDVPLSDFIFTQHKVDFGVLHSRVETSVGTLDSFDRSSESASDDGNLKVGSIIIYSSSIGSSSM